MSQQKPAVESVPATPVKFKPTRVRPDDTQLPCKPEEAVSIFCRQFPKSVSTEWTPYFGIGWAHQSEAREFEQKYGQCSITKRWSNRDYLVQTYNGLMINRTHIKSGDWVICRPHGLAAPKDSTRSFFSDDGVEQRADKSWVDEHTFIDDFDSKRYSRRSHLKVAGSEKYKCISRRTLSTSKHFHSCAQCGVVAEIASNLIQDYPDDGFQQICSGCYEAAMAKGVIKAHNHTEYPRPIFTAPPSNRITKEAKDRTLKLINSCNHPMAGKSWEQIQQDKVMLFGVECETEFTSRGTGLRARLALQAWKALGQDFCIIKHDGSLSGTRDPEAGERIRRGGDFGFEIVSAPCDLATHRERWQRLESMKDYKELRAWDVGTCGLHVHVSRGPMTTLQICRITYMINHPKLKKFIELVAGRCAARYNKFIPKRMTDGTRPEMDKDKYTAINIKHPKTIEFRIFRGTVNWRHIIRNIEFVQAVVQYCHPGDRSLRDLENRDAFIRFAASHRKEWPELNRWLDIQSEFFKLVKDTEGAYGPKDERTIRGEKPVVIDEVHDPAAVDKSTTKKPTNKTPFEELVDILDPAGADGTF